MTFLQDTRMIGTRKLGENMANLSELKGYIARYSELDIINTQQLYKQHFKNQSEVAYYKQISRLAQQGTIVRLSKSVYCKPKEGQLGKLIASEKEISQYFCGKKSNNGVIVGYAMYYNYKLTTQVPKNIIIYSNLVNYQRRNFNRVEVIKADLFFDLATRKIIELLDVLENINNIQDLNVKNTMQFFRDASKHYNEKLFTKIISTLSFKKSTIASLKIVLDQYGILHQCDNLLSPLSKYNTRKVQEIYATTS